MIYSLRQAHWRWWVSLALLLPLLLILVILMRPARDLARPISQDVVDPWLGDEPPGAP